MLILTSEGRRYPGRTDPTTLQFRFTTARSFLFFIFVLLRLLSSRIIFTWSLSSHSKLIPQKTAQRQQQMMTPKMIKILLPFI